MKSQQHCQDGVDFEDQIDEYEDHGGSLLNIPKRSSIRRKERFRAREFEPELNYRGRRKPKRQSIRTDSEFWEV